MAIPLRSAERTAIARLAEGLSLPKFAKSSVWLAGAGPGDPGLITVLGLHALAGADAVLYDALINPALLELVRPGADLIFAGKRRGQKSCRQADISATLVGLACAGKRVLRLKGGDPFVFGRGAEEALALTRAGITFRIVPGVTAGIGGLAYAGIPLTTRDTNHSVTFITGHDASGHLPQFDWQALAHATPVLVAYMALAHAEEIAERLIAAGRAPHTPAAIVSAASTERQSRQVTTLSRLGHAARTAQPPAIIVIGENVSLANELDWLTTLPPPQDSPRQTTSVL
ncbi:MAG: uroporphyrinogen-III C-methyltransferase [Alphaproteobacteria bacterium]|nr:uroporphyrinogen-III C-methyltransferase [Alphaproteobacteria bacterium]